MVRTAYCAVADAVLTSYLVSKAQLRCGYFKIFIFPRILARRYQNLSYVSYHLLLRVSSSLVLYWEDAVTLI
jgi:hypothetical protein